MHVLFVKQNFRIVEVSDELQNIDDLKGDTYNPQANPDIDPAILAKQEQRFESVVYIEGVYGYILEKWNPEVGIGWEHVDSCFGFVGRYSATRKDFDHYIVGEMKQTIKKEIGE
jgi:hypothetical protein